jgi:2-dehydropantoate 2-reductase
MRLTVLGAGGVGGYFGGRLARAGADVTFIARGAHLEALNATGLSVRSVHGDFTLPVRATDDASTVGAADFVLVAVKSYDLDGILPMLPGLLGDDTAVVSLQNGVHNEERLAATLGAHRVIGAAAYIFATIGAPGVIDHTGGPARVVLGDWPEGVSSRVASLVEAFRSADVTAEESPNIRVVLWSKFAFICAQAGTTAAARLPIGEIRARPAGRRLFRDLVAEVCAVAAAEGIELPADLPDQTVDLDSLDPESFSSLHHDLVHGRRMELDELHGEVLRRADVRGIEVPATRAIYGVLQPWAARCRPPQQP